MRLVPYISTQPRNSTIIYVGANGDDSNSGYNHKNPTTLTGLAGMDLTDRKVLFRRGDVFNQASLSLSSNNTKIATYGDSENAPKFYGSAIASGWTDQGGGIYSIVTTDPVGWVYLNEAQMQVAKSPYMEFSASTNQLTLVDPTFVNSLSSPTTAKLRALEYNYRISYEHTISDYTAGVLTLGRNYHGDDNLVPYCWLYNTLELLTEDFRWCFDSGTSTLYVKLPSHPDNYTIRYNTVTNGFFITGDGINVDGLEFAHYQKKAVFCEGSQDTLLGNLEIHNCRGNGIYAWKGGKRLTITQCDITNIANSGIRIGSYYQGEISYNTISQIGTGDELGYPHTDSLLDLPGYPINANHGATDDTARICGNGVNFDFDYNEVYTLSSRFHCHHNTITEVAYGCFKSIGNDNHFYKNHCTNFGRVWEDLGGIGTFQGPPTSYPANNTSQNKIYNNIVEMGSGRLQKWRDAFSWDDDLLQGIFLDGYSQNADVHHNVVVMQGGQGSKTNMDNLNQHFHHNIFMGPGSGYRSGNSIQDAYNIILEHNIYIVTDNADVLATISSMYEQGYSDNNYFITPYQIAQFEHNDTNYNFADWKTASGQDANSILYEDFIETPDPENDILLITNPSDNILNGTAPAGYVDVDNNPVTDYSIPAWYGLILIKEPLPALATTMPINVSSTPDEEEVNIDWDDGGAEFPVLTVEADVTEDEVLISW